MAVFIEVPIGLRHYFYLPSRTAFFLDVAANVDIPFGTIQHTYEGDMNIGSGVNYVVGAGCRIRDRFSIEARYYSAKEITEGNPGWTSTYQTTAFILGYRIF